MTFLEVGNPKNLPPSSRISSLGQFGLAHLDIMGFKEVRLALFLDVAPAKRVAWKSRAAAVSTSGRELASPGLPVIYLDQCLRPF
jgi:hypothetical protein